MATQNLNIITPPRAPARRLRQPTPLPFHTPSTVRRFGTSQFEELDFDSEKTVLVSNRESLLSRESSFNSLKDTTSGKRSINFGLWWTTALVGLPILGFTAALLALVFVHRVP